MIKFESLTWTTTKSRSRRRGATRECMEASLPEGGKAVLRLRAGEMIPSALPWRAWISTPLQGTLGFGTAETPKAAFQAAAREAVRRAPAYVEELRRTIQEVKRVRYALWKPGARKLRRGR